MMKESMSTASTGVERAESEQKALAMVLNESKSTARRARRTWGKERDGERAGRREVAYTQEEADRSIELPGTSWRLTSRCSLPETSQHHRMHRMGTGICACAVTQFMFQKIYIRVSGESNLLHNQAD